MSGFRYGMEGKGKKDDTHEFFCSSSIPVEKISAFDSLASFLQWFSGCEIWVVMINIGRQRQITENWEGVHRGHQQLDAEIIINNETVSLFSMAISHIFMWNAPWEVFPKLLCPSWASLASLCCYDLLRGWAGVHLPWQQPALTVIWVCANMQDMTWDFDAWHFIQIGSDIRQTRYIMYVVYFNGTNTIF